MTIASRRNVLLVDLDGTLTDPAEGIVRCFRLALAAMGRPAAPEADLRWIIGPPLRQSFASLLGGAERADDAVAAYRARYSSAGLFEASVHNGVPEALGRLKASGVRLILCTSKPAVYARRILERFGLDGFFDAVHGSGLDGRLEDKGDLIAHILAVQGLDAGGCVMVGDRGHDVAGAGRRAPRDPDHRRALGVRRGGGAQGGGRGRALRHAGRGPSRFRPPYRKGLTTKKGSLQPGGSCVFRAINSGDKTLG